MLEPGGLVLIHSSLGVLKAFKWFDDPHGASLPADLVQLAVTHMADIGLGPESDIHG